MGDRRHGGIFFRRTTTMGVALTFTTSALEAAPTFLVAMPTKTPAPTPKAKDSKATSRTPTGQRRARRQRCRRSRRSKGPGPAEAGEGRRGPSAEIDAANKTDAEKAADRLADAGEEGDRGSGTPPTRKLPPPWPTPSRRSAQVDGRRLEADADDLLADSSPPTTASPPQARELLGQRPDDNFRVTKPEGHGRLHVRQHLPLTATGRRVPTTPIGGHRGVHPCTIPTQAARSALAALRWQSTLPYRPVGFRRLRAGIGATVNVRKPVSAGCGLHCSGPP